MKGFQVIIFIFLSVFSISSARVYDEKSDAIKDIEKKFKETKEYQTAILGLIQNEIKSANSSTGERDQLKILTNKINETKNRYEEITDEIIRKVIIQDKPVSVIYCIRTVSDAARKEIIALENNLKIEIFAIKINKYQKINFDSYAVGAVIKGLQELTNEYIAKINKGEVQISQLKKEALKRIDNAHHILGEIEVTVSDPNLASNYIKMRQNIDRACKRFIEVWGAKVEECLK